MSEKKWVRLKVGVSYDSWAVCEPLDRSGDAVSGTPFVVLPMDTLHDAPDDEQLRLLESLKDERGAMLDRIADAAGVNTWQESVSAISALRDRVAELERKNRRLSEAWNDDQRERDEARREAEVARAHSNADRNATNKACRERDAARREAAELRAENERLHDIACSKLADELETTPKDDQPAPQTHFQSQDVILSSDGKSEYRLLLRRRVDKNGEGWFVKGGLAINVHPRVNPILERDGVPTDDQPAPQTHCRAGDLVHIVGLGGPYRFKRFLQMTPTLSGSETWSTDRGNVCLRPEAGVLLERDGVPTDEGLRRLAEKAGLEFATMDYQVLRFTTSETEASLSEDATANDRRALAAALREMGGA